MLSAMVVVALVQATQPALVPVRRRHRVHYIIRKTKPRTEAKPAESVENVASPVYRTIPIPSVNCAFALPESFLSRWNAILKKCNED